MFTGLVAGIGSVEQLEQAGSGARIRVASEMAGEIEAGDSVAVSGVCLTAATVDRTGNFFEADVANQTLKLTSLGSLQVGDGVNLELALRPQDRMGGHIVAGHVDGTGGVLVCRQDGMARRIEISIPKAMRRYVVDRGSVTVDGVSLTVAETTQAGFEVSLIPETLTRTTLGAAALGAVVNIELDVIARYVESLMTGFTE